MEKRWQIKKPAPRKFIERFPEYHPIILQLLYHLGLKNEREMETFLDPDWERDLGDPFLLKDMEKAVSRIKDAIKNKDKVGIFGHFDVDGVTAAAVLKIALEKMGLKTSVYIPDRQEGYGIIEEGIFQFQKEDVKLIITGDCGISSASEVELCKKMNIDVIITDHHEIPALLPKAKAIINPHQKDCRYPFKELAGVGVAFKLVQALGLPPKDLKWLIDLVGLGTICDVVPLSGENRLLAKFGLLVLNKTKRIGLKQLYEIAQITPGEIDTYAVSFIIGPRLNAPGRMDHANTAFYLLLSKNAAKAHELAIALNDHNKERQDLLKKMLDEAKREIETKGLLKNKLILIGKNSWPDGIVGLLAGRLKDEYSRPVLALTIGEKESKGSARSVDNFHITEILADCSDCLLKFGGHKRAAGFSLKTAKIKELYEKLIKMAEVKLKDDDLLSKIEIDAEVNLADITWDFWQELNKFEPTGFANPVPLFLARKVKPESVRKVGKKFQHLKMTINGLDAIYFNGGEINDRVVLNYPIDIVFKIDLDEFKGRRKLQLKIVDLKMA